MIELATSAAAETAGLLLLLKIFEEGRPPVGPGATAALRYNFVSYNFSVFSTFFSKFIKRLAKILIKIRLVVWTFFWQLKVSGFAGIWRVFYHFSLSFEKILEFLDNY